MSIQNIHVLFSMIFLEAGIGLLKSFLFNFHIQAKAQQMNIF